MSKHLEREMELLKKMVLEMGTAVEESIDRAILAVTQRNKAEADEVIKKDTQIDDMEVRVEEECLKILALHQPVAIDLRHIIGILKLNGDLERMADLAVNIAERAMYLATHESVKFPSMLEEIVTRVRMMVRESLDALVNKDVKLALKVTAEDETVDALHRKVFEWVEDFIRKDASKTAIVMHFVSCSRYLERIADHATNVAEDVLYMVTGDIVRHHLKEYGAGVKTSDV